MEPAKNQPSAGLKPHPRCLRPGALLRKAGLKTAGWLLAVLAGLAACSSGGVQSPTLTPLPSPTALPLPTLTPIPTSIPIQVTEGSPRIAFMSDRGGNFDIYIMDLDGRNLVNLTNNEGQDGLPAWSAPAGAFAFLSDRVLGQLAVFRQEGLDGEPVVMNTNPPPTADQPHWSPDGRYLAYQGDEPSASNIYLLDIAADETLELSPSLSLDSFGAWSADSQQVLFSSTRDGGLAIFLADLSGGAPTRLTDPSAASTYPAWSPDGSKIAFTSDRDDDVEVYLMDADGGNVIRLTEAPGFDGYPTWSPDGTRIAFVSNRDGNAEIYVMNADGSDQTNLTNNAAEESTQGDFSWSPDGSMILFQTDRDGDVEVYVMDADGGNPTNLSANPASDLGSIWVP